MQRIISIDIARALCMIWIVAFWHLGPRLGYNIQKDVCYETITYISLAAFTFYSGLFLGKKEISAFDFYKKRFIRFYPLFFMVCVLMYMSHGGIKSLLHLFYALTGLSIFIPPHTPVLWYMDMLLVFYVITPVMLESKYLTIGGGKTVNILIRAFILYSLFYVMSCYTRMEGILQYFPFYIVGMIIPINSVQIGSFKRCIALATTMTVWLIIILLLIIKYGLFRDLYVEELLNVCGVFLIIAVTNIVEKKANSRVLELFSILSYASLTAYLLHNMCFGIFKAISSDADGTIPIYMAPMILVIIFVVSYYVQKLYDKLVFKMSK